MKVATVDFKKRKLLSVVESCQVPTAEKASSKTRAVSPTGQSAPSSEKQDLSLMKRQDRSPSPTELSSESHYVDLRTATLYLYHYRFIEPDEEICAHIVEQLQTALTLPTVIVELSDSVVQEDFDAITASLEGIARFEVEVDSIPD